MDQGSLFRSIFPQAKRPLSRAMGALPLLFLCALGCAGSQGGADLARSASADVALLEKGREYAALGQSVRAEQYFLAAARSGANSATVFELIIETCVASGRLGSALRHVEDFLRKNPDDPRLIQLAASLNEALGHDEAARQLVLSLTRSEAITPEGSLFIAEFFDRAGTDRQEAIARYQRYLSQTEPENQAPWAAPALRRLLAQEDAPVALSIEGANDGRF